MKPFVLAFGCILLLLTIYVGSYFALVRGTFVNVDFDGRPWVTGVPYQEIGPKYRFGGDVSKAVFTPIHSIDRVIRPERWPNTRNRAWLAN